MPRRLSAPPSAPGLGARVAAAAALAAVALAFMASPASPQAARIASITPSSAARGEPVMITGIGFGAGNVRISVGGVVAEVLTATGHSAIFRVPPGARPGVTTVTATNPGGHTGSVAFEVLNLLPQAHAGPDQTVFVTGTVRLDGSASTDADGDQLVFHWSLLSRPNGSHAVLSDPSAVRPTSVLSSESEHDPSAQADSLRSRGDRRSHGDVGSSRRRAT